MREIIDCTYLMKDSREEEDDVGGTELRQADGEHRNIHIAHRPVVNRKIPRPPVVILDRKGKQNGERDTPRLSAFHQSL